MDYNITALDSLSHSPKLSKMFLTGYDGFLVHVTVFLSLYMVSSESLKRYSSGPGCSKPD